MDLSDIELFIPYHPPDDSKTFYESRDRRLRIGFTTEGNILITDQYYKEGCWNVSEYASTLDFPVHVLPSIMEQLERLQKLLILK
jgi:hypothetical protein